MRTGLDEDFGEVRSTATEIGVGVGGPTRRVILEGSAGTSAAPIYELPVKQ